MERATEHDSTLEFRVDHSDRATARRASENHMSTGRYAVWEQESPEKAPEEYADMPIREVMGKPSEPGPEQDLPQGGHGNTQRSPDSQPPK